MGEMTQGPSLNPLLGLDSKGDPLFLVGMLAKESEQAKAEDLGSSSVAHWIPEPGIEVS